MLVKRETEQDPRPISSFVQSIDDPTLKLAMEYFRIKDYDCFVSFVRRIGIKVETSASNQEP